MAINFLTLLGRAFSLSCCGSFEAEAFKLPMMMVLLMIMVMIVLKVPRRSAQADDEEALNKKLCPGAFPFLRMLRKLQFFNNSKNKIFLNCNLSNGDDAFIADVVSPIH